MSTTIEERLAAQVADQITWPHEDPWTRQAVREVPRHQFAPPQVWQWDGGAYAAVAHAADAQRWAQAVYAGPREATVTQVTRGHATSSLSSPEIVVDMLHALRLEPGHRVLELGTGAGWNAALLAWRSGPGLVHSVETDAGLAARARARLKESGAAVYVHVGDGAEGWAPGARYDRVIATYAVDEVPWAWVAQARPGGRIVAPLGHLGHLALKVAADGLSACGWVEGLAAFMPARSATTPMSWQSAREAFPGASERAWRRRVEPLVSDWHLRFALRVLLPDVQLVPYGGLLLAWGRDGSWAQIRPDADGEGEAQVTEGGVRSLVEEIDQAWEEARGLVAGGEGLSLWDFGLTVTPDGQWWWYGNPGSELRWPVAGARAAV